MFTIKFKKQNDAISDRVVQNSAANLIKCLSKIMGLQSYFKTVSDVRKKT